MAIFVQDNICSDRNQTMMPICVNVYMHVGVCINMYMIVDMCMSIYWPCLLLLFFFYFFFSFFFHNVRLCPHKGYEAEMHLKIFKHISSAQILCMDCPTAISYTYI